MIAWFISALAFGSVLIAEERFQDGLCIRWQMRVLTVASSIKETDCFI